MMSLLTPNESHTFQSFLASIDHADHPDRMAYPNPEWAVYGGIDLDDEPIPAQAQGKEALAKATKDLMSLEPQGWNSAAVCQSGSLANGRAPYHQSFHHSQQQTHQGGNSYSYHQQHALGNEVRPFLLHKSPTHSHPHPQQPGLPSLSPITIAPTHTIGPGSSATPPLSTASSSSTRSTSSTPTPATTPPSPHPPGLNHDPLPQTVKRPMSSYEHGHTSHKRLRPSPVSSPTEWPHSRQNMNLQTRSNSQPTPTSSVTQPARSNTHPIPHLSRSNGTPHPNLRPPKPTLLSPSQKKANHIQSEQKRRANIRKGYEALCENVPALREALREEEMRGSPLDGADGEGKEGKGRGARTKRGRGRGKSDDAGEKVDGRAGPRSENVVLSKTIDYINDLRSEHAHLLSRLRHARSLLAPGHPALIPDARAFESISSPGCSKPTPNGVPVPLWEREWTGGEGKTGIDEDDDYDDDGMDD